MSQTTPDDAEPRGCAQTLPARVGNWIANSGLAIVGWLAFLWWDPYTFGAYGILMCVLLPVLLLPMLLVSPAAGLLQRLGGAVGWVILLSCTWFVQSRPASLLTPLCPYGVPDSARIISYNGQSTWSERWLVAHFMVDPDDAVALMACRDYLPRAGNPHLGDPLAPADWFIEVLPASFPTVTRWYVASPANGRDRFMIGFTDQPGETIGVQAHPGR